ncbi:ribonuclease catalytic domain-containing protein [Breznakiellaceae bacterium SP9]
MKLNSLALYKNKSAIVAALSGDKIEIRLSDGTSQKVREKDITLLHPGPITRLSELEDTPRPDSDELRGAWELLSGADEALTLAELAELLYGTFSPGTAWAAWQCLDDGFYFSGTIQAIRPKSAEAIAAEEKKRSDKEREGVEREALLQRLKTRTLQLPADKDKLHDVEALAYGKAEKCRTLRDLGLSETPEAAHRLCLESGLWDSFVNPHPARHNINLNPPKVIPQKPSNSADEERIDLRHLCALAIDNAWSDDPDDAVSIEQAVGEPFPTAIWVHVADPAAVIMPNSPVDVEAMARGATVYLPEGLSRMIAEESLADFALGITAESPALSFKIRLNKSAFVENAHGSAINTIEGTEIMRSVVRVTRLSYEEADTIANAPVGQTDRPAIQSALKQLYSWAAINEERRLNSGAVVSIDMPEMHITVRNGVVNIEPEIKYQSSAMVRECMVLAGEACAKWALAQALPFPYISQEAGELPDEISEGLAGSYQLRRGMRPRSVSTRPAVHWGLGLDEYTQVTSPLRRYLDLLAHQQIRAVLCCTPPLSAEELQAHLAAGDAALTASVRAERASRAHWTCVYLQSRIGSTWDAVVLENKGSRVVCAIPLIGLETQVALRGRYAPNDTLKLTLKAVDIPASTATFQVE